MLQAHQLSEYFDRTQPVKSLAWSDVQQVRKLIQLLLAVLGQVGALWQKLADKVVGVLVGPALPGTVRVSKVNSNPHLLSEFSVPGHFLALVIRHAYTSDQRHSIERRAEPFDRRRRRRVIHIHQHQVAAGALNERPNRRGVVLPLDQVSLQMPRHQAVVILRRAQSNTDHIGNLAATVNAPSARTTCALALSQTLHQLLAQLSDRHRLVS